MARYPDDQSRPQGEKRQCGATNRKGLTHPGRQRAAIAGRSRQFELSGPDSRKNASNWPFSC